jgi:ribonuclease R
MNILAQRILTYIEGPSYRPEDLKGIGKKLGLKRERLTALQEAVDELVADGVARVTTTGLILGRSTAGLVTGRCSKTSAGDGYVTPAPPVPRGVVGDIFIDRGDMKDTQNGDTVLVKLTSGRRAGGQRTAEIVEVVERATTVFVGTYYEEDDAGWVKIDGRHFSQPVSVGDPGAKGVQPDDKVVVEMLRFPTEHRTGEAVLTKVLGLHGETGVDTQLVIHEYGLPTEFTEPALEEARRQADRFDEKDVTDRQDLTGDVIVTIDPADARDFDDAISLRQDDRGHWFLGVHVADVSHFVEEGSPLDDDARTRATSVYLPAHVIPMLPEVISNGLASLQEGRVRYVVTANIEFDEQGNVRGRSFHSSAIKVAKRFAYEQVMPIVQHPDRHKEIDPAIRRLLCDMHALAMKLRRKRFREGAINLNLPEVKLDLDKDLRVVGAHEAFHDESHQMIEEFMLAANVAVANELADRGVPFPRRVHSEPNLPKLKAFAEFVAALGFQISKPQNRKELQGLLSRVEGTPQERAIHFAMLRSLKQAEYSPLEIGHFALAEENYCHFTSPIRRYPDLIVHRLMKRIIDGEKKPKGYRGDALLHICAHCSMAERRAADAERTLSRVKLLLFLKDKIGKRMPATITGVDRYGFFCRGIDLPAEGLVHVSELPGPETYEYDRVAQRLVGRRTGCSFQLGDRVEVEVASVDVDRRELDLLLVSQEKRPPKKGAPGKKPPSDHPGGRRGRPRGKK